MPLGDGEAELQLKNDVPTQLCVEDVGYPPILYSGSFGQLKNGRTKALAVTWSLRVVHGVSKVCQVSQLYPAINDLLPESWDQWYYPLFTVQASCFSSWPWVKILFLFVLAEPRWWVELQHNSKQTDGELSEFYLFMDLFIHCRLIPFFCLPNFQGLHMWYNA